MSGAESQSFDQMSVKSLGADQSAAAMQQVPVGVGVGVGGFNNLLPASNSFHPGYIRTIQFADYCNSPPGSTG